jgi:uncharacterized protein (DUF1330 family)
MLNLVRLRHAAVYPQQHARYGQALSGEEAYRAYGEESGPILNAVGGLIVYSANFEFVLIGPDSECWDIVFIAQYPSTDAFVSMVKNIDYQKAVVHRQAAVRTSRLIRLSPKKAGNLFG